MNIEIILLGVIGLVFLIDFIMNSRKKQSVDNVVDQIEGGEPVKKGVSNSFNISVLILIQIIANTIITLWIILYQDSNFLGKTYAVLGYPAYNYFIYLLNILLIPLYFFSDYSENPALNYILKRKKNFTLFVLSVPLTKVLLHYLLYPITDQAIIKRGAKLTRTIREADTLGEKYRASVGDHIDAIFTDKLLLFIPALILVSLVVWFFNDKIKAR
mgnify:CR=1 FL=1